MKDGGESETKKKGLSDEHKDVDNKTPYSMETKPLMQTLETPIKTT